MDSFGKVAEIIITAFLFFLAPLQYGALKAEMVYRDYVKAEAVYLTDSVRNTGFLTAQMFENFTKKIAETGNIYEVELSQYKKRYQKTGEGILPFYEGIFDQDIKQSLFQTGNYYFDQGDLIRICIRQKNQSFASVLSSVWYANAGKASQTLVIYGGAVRDEIN